MIAYWLLIAHLIGDYLLQSDWMAVDKTKASLPAAAHALTYTIPFIFITQSPLALAVICVTHFLLDRFRVARYVCWLKNFMAPKWIELEEVEYVHESNRIGYYPKKVRNHSWAECSGTGYHKDRPPWLSTWLLIIADNTIHLLINGLAVQFL